MKLSSWKGVLLVVGTCIGGGMLALPIQTAQAGAIPAFAILSFTATMMMFTSYLLGKLCIKHKTNIVSLAKIYFGNVGSTVTIAGYVFLFYAFTVAYISAIKHIFSTIAPGFPIVSITIMLTTILVYKMNLLATVNQWLMYGLITSYLLLIKNINSVDIDLLLNCNWSYLDDIIPVAVNAFNFHLIIPTLMKKIDYDKKRFLLITSCGVLLTFTIYFLWNSFVIGNVEPKHLLSSNDNAITPLAKAVNKPFIVVTGMYFSLFAVTTSLLGVSMAFVDIFSDAIKVKNKNVNITILFAMLVSSTAIIKLYPEIFRKAVTDYAGIGIAFLAGLLIVAMAFKEYKVFTIKKLILMPCGAFFFYVILLIAKIV